MKPQPRLLVRSARRLAAAASLLSLAACVSYAPPIRTNHYGAPGRMDAGMIEAAGGVVYSPELSGGPMLGYGLTESCSLEAGAEVDALYEPRAIAYLGTRYTPLRPERGLPSFVLDLEGGAGAGVGGDRCVDNECAPDYENFRRPAGGAYLGLGIGGKIKWFSPWLRVRAQVSGAEGAPVTSYFTAIAGVQFDLTELAHLYLGTGGIYMLNSEISIGGWQALNAGLSFTVATPRTKRLREQRAERAASPPADPAAPR